MPAKANITVPLALAYDTRGVLAYANASTNAQDQRRVNSYYEITRQSVGVPPEVVLVKRPGVTVDAGTYGAGTQVQYLVGRKPDDTWDAAPWIFVKDSTNNKVVNSSTSTTILNDTNFIPRFWDLVQFGTTKYIVVQLQNTATPSGAGNQKVYYCTTDIATWTQISDADFTGLNMRGKMEFMDGYAFIADSNNRIWQSSLNDLTAWATTDFIGKTIKQDAPQGLMKVRNQILFFGEETVEVFINEGNASGSVLGRIPQSAQLIGLGNVAGGGSGLAGKTHYYTTIADVAYFVGRFGGQAIDNSLISYNGNSFEKISRPMEDKILTSSTIYSINRMTFGGKIAVAIQMTLPSATTQKWLMYFPDLNEWFEWESTVYGPVNNGFYYAGATNPQKLYTFAASNKWQDDSTNFTMTTQFRLPVADLRWKTMPICGVIADSTSSSKDLGVSFSDDDGTTWTTARNIDLSLRKKELTGCGGFRERFVRLTSTNDTECRLRRFYSAIPEEVGE